MPRLLRHERQAPELPLPEPGRRHVRGDGRSSPACRAARARPGHLGHGGGFPRLRQRRPARHPRHRARRRELPPLPQPGEGPLPGRDVPHADSAPWWLGGAAGATASSTSTTTAGRTSSPPTPTSTTRSTSSRPSPTGCPTASSATAATGRSPTRRPTSGLAAGPARAHRGAAFADLDDDGRLDAVVTALEGPTELWRNRSEGAGHWLRLRLVGTKSNRDGIGAVVRIAAASDSRWRDQWSHATTAVGYASSTQAPLHFGTGAATDDRPRGDPLAERGPPGPRERRRRPDAHRERDALSKDLVTPRSSIRAATRSAGLRIPRTRPIEVPRNDKFVCFTGSLEMTESKRAGAPFGAPARSSLSRPRRAGVNDQRRLELQAQAELDRVRPGAVSPVAFAAAVGVRDELQEVVAV